MKASGFCLNINKMHFVQFTSKVSHQIDLDICFACKLVSTFYGREILETYLHSTPFVKMNFEQNEHELQLDT